MAINLFTPTDASAPHVQLEAPSDGSPIQITDASLLFKGDYSRSGNDLEITGPDGNTVTIEGYFGSGAPAALMSPNGAMLNGNIVEALAGPLFPGQYAQASGASQPGNPIGEVLHLEGTATATRTDGSVVQLTPGTKVYLGDVVETGANTKFGLNLEDGSLFSMTSDARMVLNEFVFNSEQAQDSSMLVNLVQGAFVFVAGSIAPTGNMKVETPVAVLAIRGTTVGAEIDTQVGTTAVSLFQDVDSQHIGWFQVLSKIGSIEIAKVTQIGNKLVITGIGETPIVIELTDQDLLNQLDALELIKTIYAKWIGQQGSFDSESGSGSFLDIQLVSLGGSFTLGDLSDNPLAQASALKSVIDVPDQDDPPIAFFDGFFTDEDDIFAGNVISNTSIQEDVDPEGFDVRVIGFGEDLVWEPDEFDFNFGVIPQVGFATFTLSSGAVVNIDSAGNFTYNPNPAFDFLAEGESAVDSFTYLIADPGNSTDSDTVEVTVFGRNDAPAVAVIAQSDLIEQTDTLPLTTNIDVTFIDVDLTDVGHTAAITAVNATGVTAGLALNDAALIGLVTPGVVTKVSGSENGSVTLGFSAASTAFDYLSDGEIVTLEYTVAIDDGEVEDNIGTQTFVVTIEGTNDAPVVDVIAQSDLFEQTDTLPLTTNIDVTFTDVDLTDVGHTAAITGVSATGVTTGLALNDAALIGLVTPGAVTKVSGSENGSVTLGFSAASTVFDYLSAGEVVTLEYTVAIDDQETEDNVGTQTFVVEITGTNDTSVIDEIAQSDLNEQTDTSPLTTNIDVTFKDVDLTDTGHSAAITGVSATGVTTGLALNDAALMALITPGVVSKVSGTENGSVILAFSAESTAFDYLSAGQVVTLEYTVAIDDQETENNVGTQTFVVEITGTNDAAVVAGIALTEFTEQTDASPLTADIDVAFTDVDLTDVGHTATITGAEALGIVGGLGLDEAGLIALLTVGEVSKETGSAEGSVTLAFSAPSTAFNYLALSEIAVVRYTLEIDDGDGGVTTKTFDVAITGTDDPVQPVINEVLSTDIDGLDGNPFNASFLQSPDAEGIVTGNADATDVVIIPETALEDIAALEGPYSIIDFEPTNDVLDLSLLLDETYTGVIGDYVKLVDDGVNVTVQYDQDGTGPGGVVDLAVLEGVSSADEINIIAPVVTS